MYQRCTKPQETQDYYRDSWNPEIFGLRRTTERLIQVHQGLAERLLDRRLLALLPVKLHGVIQGYMSIVEEQSPERINHPVILHDASGP